MGPQTPRNLSRRVLEESAQAGAGCSSPWTSACFDRGRCVGANGLPKLSIYAHDFNCTNALSSEIMARSKAVGQYRSVPIIALKIFREIALEKGILVDRAEDACIIVYAVAARSRCLPDTSEWNGGRNHLLIDFNDEPRQAKQGASPSGTAMWAEVNMQSRYFRFGYDIAVPFPPKVTFDGLADISPTKRKYFATFKGQLYLSRAGVEERSAIRQLGVSANSSDVVVLESCQELHKEHLLPENVELCQNLKKESLQHDYNDLMNTTFALIPAGRSPATYRLGEAMSAGAIPVFFHNGFVKPYPDRIPWRLCSFTFSLEDAPVVIDILRAVPKKKLFFLQGMALHVYRKYFSNGMNGIVETALETMEDRLTFQSERVR
ncbi:unnamed protein product [Ascophyllum nodosum]